MLKPLSNNKKTVFYAFDPVQDMLFIEFEPIHEDTIYEEVEGLPNVMYRYTTADDRLVGISAIFVEEILGSDPDDDAIRALALDLIRQTHLERVLEGA